MLCCVKVGGIKYLETFRDICAVVRGGGLEYGSELTVSSKQGGLVVSVAACRLSGPSSSLTQGTILFLVCSRGGGESGSVRTFLGVFLI